MLIGREKEQYILRQALQADRSRFVAVYGRRRVGKTFLIRETFDYTFTFQHSGLAKGNYRAQLIAFAESLKDAGAFNVTAPKNWMDAFRQLKALIRTSKDDRKVIFIDELSWMDTPRSDLLMALENFWNGFASARKDILLIICTSATSWILCSISSSWKIPQLTQNSGKNLLIRLAEEHGQDSLLKGFAYSIQGRYGKNWE